MFQWQQWRPWQENQFVGTAEIDLGSGKKVHAVDLVDGHAQRLRENTAGLDEGKRDLTDAVRVIAPQLAPLTDLAQNISNHSTPAHPTTKFRKDLQQALEISHRQQSVRRTLGIQPPAQKETVWWQSPWLMLAVAVLIVVIGSGIVARKRQGNNR